MKREQYICPECGDEIEGARYSSPKGMVCEDCDADVWDNAFKQEEDSSFYT